MSKPFKIKEIKPRIFLFEFKSHYDMCMYFLRYQEFYESPSPKFRNKSFTIFEFMRWYSLKYGKGSFTYPYDWDGFNIPGEIIGKVWDLGIEDKNFYDVEMHEAWQECKAKADGKKFYIIGVVRGNKALSHEIAHGLFYLHSEYKKEMTRLVKDMDPIIRHTVNVNLKRLGYTPKVYIDEAQAYMATGLSESFGQDKWAEHRKPFKEFFKAFSRKVK
jgi:hypothetical protein